MRRRADPSLLFLRSLASPSRFPNDLTLPLSSLRSLLTSPPSAIAVVLPSPPSSLAAGLTFRSLGWAHEGQTPLGAWDRSSLGYDEAWEEEERIPGWVDSASRSDKGKGRARSGTETEETYLNSRATSPSLGAGTRSPTILSPAPQVAGQGWYQSSTPERVRSPEVAAETRVDFGGSEPVRDDERTRREVEDDDERELMA